MIAASLVSAALTSVLPLLNPSRVDELAQSISAVAETEDDAARLVVTVARESSGLRSYETCERSGDNGLAWTSYQLHQEHWGRHSKHEICSEPVLAAELALKVLRRFKDPRTSFARFVGIGRKSSETTKRVQFYVRALTAMNGGAA